MSNLLKNSLLQTNPHLSKRVHAGVIRVAGEQSNADGTGGAFARMIQNDLSRSWPDFLLSVAADPAVQDAAVINEDSTAVITTNVTDDQILNSINYMWASVAKKYAPQPETGEPS